MFDTFAALLDWFGIVVFATTGALVASRKQMDVVGFVLLGTATGIGGGTIRDTLINALPVFWVREPAYLVTCVVVSCTAFFLAHIPQSRLKLLLWCDAVGMALFAVTGAEKALMYEARPIVGGCHGRDHGHLRRHRQGCARRREPGDPQSRNLCVGGARRSRHFRRPGGPRHPAGYALAGGFLARARHPSAALRWDWSLPRYRQRPGRTRDEIDRR